LITYEELITYEDFIATVSRRTHVETDEAERATAVALETLAERMPSGEIRDLLVHLPIAPHQPFRRGRA
jgi:uncharacterized protein (DUF2267 family)